MKVPRFSVLNTNAWSDLKRHKLLHEQLAGVRNLDLRDMRSVLAIVALESLLRQVANAHETALLADMNAVVVAHIKETFLQEASSTM